MVIVDYKKYFDEMYNYAKTIGARRERMKDSKGDLSGIDCEIRIVKEGFQVYHDNKTFLCYTGEQLVSYLKSIGMSERQLLDIQEMILKECMKRGMKFPKDLL